jgi:hypothetical protein
MALIVRLDVQQRGLELQAVFPTGSKRSDIKKAFARYVKKDFRERGLEPTDSGYKSIEEFIQKNLTIVSVRDRQICDGSYGTGPLDRND